MAGQVVTVAFQGVEARRVDVEVNWTQSNPAFLIVGLADKDSLKKLIDKHV